MRNRSRFRQCVPTLRAGDGKDVRKSERAAAPLVQLSGHVVGSDGIEAAGTGAIYGLHCSFC